ncbi:MAG: hypothetical protein S4CHLAM2_11110 [Chlamydiales bacterium]|nr:hypothetical protein [Chlamydiales bacterium]
MFPTSASATAPPPFFPEAKSYYVITTVALAALSLLILCLGFCSIAQMGTLSTVSSGWAWLMFLGGGAVLTGIALKIFCRMPTNPLPISPPPNRFYPTLDKCIEGERGLSEPQVRYLREHWNNSLLSFSLSQGVLYISQHEGRIWCITHHGESTGSLRFGDFSRYTDGGHVTRNGTHQTGEAYIRTLSGVSSR